MWICAERNVYDLSSPSSPSPSPLLSPCLPASCPPSSPSITHLRARLRHNRALFRHRLYHVHHDSSISPSCLTCHVDETLEHVLLHCACFDAHRYYLTLSLTSPPLSRYFLSPSLPLICGIIPTHVPASLHPLIHTHTATFLTALQRIYSGPI